MFTRVGDQPERIVAVEVQISDPVNWKQWAPIGPPFLVIEPTVVHEGVREPVVPSRCVSVGIAVSSLSVFRSQKQVDVF